MQNLIPSFPLLTLIICLGLIIFRLLSTKFRLSIGHAVLSAFLCAPFILSLYLYFQFYFFPNKQNIFYLCLLFLPLLLIFAISYKSYLMTIVEVIAKIRSTVVIQSRSVLTVLFSVLLASILLLCSLRIFLWPISWDDQIYYIEQAYAIGHSKSLAIFWDWGNFDDGKYVFDLNPAIRPGLPMVYAPITLLSQTLDSVRQYSQIVTFYLLVITIGTVCLVSWHSKTDNFRERVLFTLLLIFCSYQFIDHSVQGFKELAILNFALLVLDRISSPGYLATKLDFIYFGVLLGFMSFIGLVGTLMAIILIPLIWFSTHPWDFKKIVMYLVLGITMTFFSGVENIYFINWTLSGGRNENSTVKLVSEYTSRIFVYLGLNGDKTKLQKELIRAKGYEEQELRSYQINSSFDKFTKGKLQGFFQPQFYGLAFLLFFATLISQYWYILKNRITRTILAFIFLYYIFVIDLFSINPSIYAYVTTVSHKYTVVISVFAAIITGYCWEWLKEMGGKLSLQLVTVACVIILSGCSWMNNNYNLVLEAISLVVPIHNNSAYYIDKLTIANTVTTFLTFFALLVIGISKIVWGKYLFVYWRNHKLGFGAVTLVILYLPLLFFFDTNKGLVETITHSFSSKEQKLADIKGWEAMYYMVNYLNRLPPETRLLMTNINYPLMAIHLDVPSNHIIKLYSPFSDNVDGNFLKINNIDYLLVNSKANKPDVKTKHEYTSGNYLLLSVH